MQPDVNSFETKEDELLSSWDEVVEISEDVPVLDKLVSEEQKTVELTIPEKTQNTPRLSPPPKRHPRNTPRFSRPAPGI